MHSLPVPTRSSRSADHAIAIFAARQPFHGWQARSFLPASLPTIQAALGVLRGAAPYHVVLDANVWLSERVLQTSIRSAFLYLYAVTGVGAVKVNGLFLHVIDLDNQTPEVLGAVAKALS
jgi:hypothetical protein